MRSLIAYTVVMLLLAACFCLVLCTGVVDIPLRDVWGALSGSGTKDTWRYIVLESRLPMALAAILSGAGLSVAGLVMQTTFSNPLAGPSIMGVSSGASLGVALVSLSGVTWLGMSPHTAFGGLGLGVAGAIFGAMVVVALLAGFSSFLRSGITLLVVGIMFSYLASSLISLLNFFAPAEDVKSFAIWGMGSFMGVPLRWIPTLAGCVLVLLCASFCLAKPLNALLLGERYAHNLGYSVRRVRTWILVVAGLLTAVITAFCGPIGFIGLTVPHLARLMLRSSNHFVLLPATILIGALVTLFCSWLTVAPTGWGVIPINAVTPLIGVPVIFYLLLCGRKLAYFN